eukprot:c12180_g1_i1.p1 GENE.c12180_g1_i1~~c12180_g1_i1.p1  ORF type:complete len:263 (+),score=74.70 c12180_g1_i1:58-846(+)
MYLRNLLLLFAFTIAITFAAIPDLCSVRIGSLCDSICNSDSVIRYNKFDRFTVCIELLSNHTESNVTTAKTTGRIVAFPKVDEFSEIAMRWNTTGSDTNGFNPLVYAKNVSGVIETGDVGYIQAYSTGVTDDFSKRNMLQSPQSLKFFDPVVQAQKNNSLVVLFYTLVVNMDMGRPIGLSWEMGDCSSCGNDNCVSGTTCGLTVTSTNCDSYCKPKVYIAFSGTDGRGQILTSTGSMLTRFSSYGLTNLYGDVKDRSSSSPF